MLPRFGAGCRKDNLIYCRRHFWVCKTEPFLFHFCYVLLTWRHLVMGECRQCRHSPISVNVDTDEERATFPKWNSPAVNRSQTTYVWGPYSNHVAVIGIRCYKLLIIIFNGHNARAADNLVSTTSGYEKLSEFIVTQHPLAHTVDDFWRMVWEHNVQTVVVLSPVDDQVSCTLMQIAHILQWHLTGISPCPCPQEFTFWRQSYSVLTCCSVGTVKRTLSLSTLPRMYKAVLHGWERVLGSSTSQ